MIKLKADYIVEKSSLRLLLTREHEGNIENLEAKNYNEIKELNEKHFAELRTLDLKLNEIKDQSKISSMPDDETEKLKGDKEV